AAAQKLLPETRENASYQQDMKDLKTALDGKRITQQQYDQTSEQLEAQHQANLAKIRSQQVVNPTQQALAEVDPVQQLANQHAQELALIQQFEQQGVLAHENALALKNAADRQYEQQRIAAMWEVYRNQSLGNEAIAASFDALAGNASNALTGIITGSMSAQEAAQSLASTVLNSLVNAFVQMGVEWARNAIMGATTQQTAIAATTAAQVAGITTQTAASTAAAVTTTAAWTPAAIMSSIASWGGAVAIGLGAMAGVMALAGKRKNGGPVSAGSMYQVGEGGKPEIYQASTGKQYMIPGDNGKVISNKDMQSGGGVSVQVNVINQSTGATVQSADGYMQDGSAVVDLLITDMERGGPVSSQMQQTFGLSRKAQATY
ncbi:tape measure protein, partial [Klebsiella pneumoniae]